MKQNAEVTDKRNIPMTTIFAFSKQDVLIFDELFSRPILASYFIRFHSLLIHSRSLWPLHEHTLCGNQGKISLG